MDDPNRTLDEEVMADERRSATIDTLIQLKASLTNRSFQSQIWADNEPSRLAPIDSVKSIGYSREWIGHFRAETEPRMSWADKQRLIRSKALVIAQDESVISEPNHSRAKEHRLIRSYVIGLTEWVGHCPNLRVLTRFRDLLRFILSLTRVLLVWDFLVRPLLVGQAHTAHV
jgi:hypothetical protein